MLNSQHNHTLILARAKAVDVFIDCNEAEVFGFVQGTLTDDLSEVLLCVAGGRARAVP